MHLNSRVNHKNTEILKFNDEVENFIIKIKEKDTNLVVLNKKLEKCNTENK